MFAARGAAVLFAAVAAACGGVPGGPSTLPAATGSSQRYSRLSQTGLYASAAEKALAADLVAFEPTHRLWSDGSQKRRWIRTPPGTRIDTTDMDHWRFPVGTQVFKEFSRGGALLETRLIERTGEGPDDYWMGAFVWLPDGSDAVFTAQGREDVNGTSHDVPSVADCLACHTGEPGRVLGFSAVQLSRSGPGTTLASLAASGRLSHPPPPGASYGPPGDAVTAAALGFLHANCGNCHNPEGPPWLLTRMELRLTTAARRPEETPTYRTAVAQPLESFADARFVFRVRPGFPQESAVWYRMSLRDPAQMPPLGTEVVDTEGLATVGRWIAALASSR